MTRSILQHRVRGSVRLLLGALTPWPSMSEPEEGYSIILGVPWALRHILAVNLDFIERCDRSRMIDLHIVFDRPRKPGMEEFANDLVQRRRDLPIRCQWHAPVAGRIAERVNVSTFYNGMNIVTALSACRARAMILHDFDLYPLRPDYFEKLGARILDDGLRFAGLERTQYDGLTDEDEIYGTWGLAMDASWLRNNATPASIFHRYARLADGRGTMLDPFSWLQLHEPARGDVPGLDPEHVCHVKNLCSTYLRLTGGKAPKVAWRLHYLIYLEAVSSGDVSRLLDAAKAMDEGGGTTLAYNGQAVDCEGTHWTCANVLERELTQMEESLYGEARPAVREYIRASREFFRRCSDPEPSSESRAAAKI